MAFPRGQTRTATGGATGGGGTGAAAAGAASGAVRQAARPRTTNRSPRSAAPARSAGSWPSSSRTGSRSSSSSRRSWRRASSGSINPLLLGLLIDQVIVGGDYENLNLYVGLMIVLPIITGLIGVGQSYLNNVIGQNVMQDLRGALYAHLQSMPLRFFTETRTGEIQSRLANDVGGVQAVVTDTASSITSNLAIAISTIIAMFLLDWRLALLSLGLTPFFLYLTYRVGKVRREVSTETQKSLAELTATTEETLSVSGILLSKTFGQQANSIAKFRGLNKRLAGAPDPPGDGRSLVLHDHRHDLLDHAGVRVLAGRHAGGQRQPERPDGRHDRRLHHAPEPAVLPARPAARRSRSRSRARWRCSTGSSSTSRWTPRSSMRPTRSRCTRPRPAARSASTTSRSRTRPRPCPRSAPTRRSRAATTTTAGRAASGRPMRELGVRRDGRGRRRRRRTERRRRRRARRRPPRPPCPSASSTSSSRPSPVELVALVGPSGSGKTTTTYLVSRLYDVDAGAVEIDDVDVRRIKLASLGEIIGTVTQETYLFHASVSDNLRYARPEATEEEIESPPRRPPRSTSGSSSCPTATTRSSASAATSCRAARSSGWRSPGCCSRTRGS